MMYNNSPIDYYTIFIFAMLGITFAAFFDNPSSAEFAFFGIIAHLGGILAALNIMEAKKAPEEKLDTDTDE